MDDGANDAILLVRSAGEPWREPAQVGYLSEADLQQMLAEQPSLIPGVGHRAVAAREFHTGVGPTDVLIVDQDGAVTVVECKLSSNAEVRRKIIGQVLDYAARLWRMPLADFEARWKACSAGVGMLDVLEDEAVQALERSLAEGSFRLVLAVDLINDDLRRIVEYLNAHTSEQVTVLAVELRRVSHGGVDILTPRSFGQESARSKQETAKADKRPAWTIEDVRARLVELDPDVEEVFDRLSAALLELGCTTHGTNAATPSMIFRVTTPDGRVAWPYAVYTGARPLVQVNFHWLPSEPPEARERFLAALSAEPVAVEAEQVRDSGFKKRPNLPLQLLANDAAHGQIVAAVAHLLGREPTSGRG